MAHNKQNVPPSLQDFVGYCLNIFVLNFTRRSTVCISASQSQKSPDAGLSNLTSAVLQGLVAFCQRSLVFDPEYCSLSYKTKEAPSFFNAYY